MALKPYSDPVQMTAHHINNGPVVMYPVDARLAVAQHPDEWSLSPWSPEDASAARKRLHERRVAAAQAAGEDPPAPPAEPQMTDADRAEFEEWKAARAKAKQILDAAKAEEAKRLAKEEEISQAEAVLASPPPRPDPNRRPLTGAAKANAERKAAADKAAAEKAAKDKAEADRQAAAAASGT